jgi:hypothetical protein
VNDPDVKLLVFIVLTASLIGAFMFFWDDIRPPADESLVMQHEPVVDEKAATGEPVHPIEPLTSTAPSNKELVPLPALDDSDGYFLLALTDIFGADVGRLLVNEALVDKFVATVDNLTRSHVSEKMRPVGRLPDPFVVDTSGGIGQLYLSPDNYARYDLLVDLIANNDPEVVAEMYRRFYPLFQQSYERLGYPNAYFNDRVVEVIDHLLLTPEPDEPVGLARPHVLYEFADADLEALSSGQKLLLRMGREHTARIKQTLRELRALIA